MTQHNNIESIRVVNLQNIINNKFSGNIKSFSEHIGRNPTAFYLITQNKKPFGERLARKIEMQLGLTIGDLDKDPTHKDTELNENIVYISEYNIKLSAGNGCEIANEDVIRQIPLLRSEVNALGWNISNLAVFTVDGESMLPTLVSGERIVIDISKKEVIDNKIFAICRDNIVLIKRLFIHPVTRKVMVKSDNQNHKEFDFEANEHDKIIGLAVHTLGRKLF